MLSLNNLRTKFGWLLAVVIAFVTIVFALNLDGGWLPDLLGEGKNPTVGKVDGDKVKYVEFNDAYQDVVALNGNSNANYDMSSQLISMAWESLLMDEVMLPNMAKLGLTYTPAEREAVLNGQLSSNVLNSIFSTNGQYDPAMLKTFLMYAENDAQRQYIWTLLEKQINNDRVSSKYMNLVRSGAYANALMVNKGVVAQNNTYKGHYVACNYATIADSLVSVSDREIQKYYKANKAKFSQTPYRTVRYAQFVNEPSEKDKKSIEATAKGAANLFREAKNLEAYVANTSNASIAPNYVAENSIPADEVAALRGGKMFEPTLKNGSWYASRLVEVLVAPKKIELQQIALPMSESHLADSLYKAVKAKGADFAAIAPQGSYADLGDMEFSSLPVELAKKLVNVKANEIVKVEFGGAIQIFKVSKVGARERHYLLATQTHKVFSSKETNDALYKEVCDFAHKVKAEGFDAAAKSVPTSSMNVTKGSRNVPGLANSVEVVRWANKAKVGDVSEIIKIGENYVVAIVTAVDESEYESIEKATAKIKPVLVAQKKAAILKEKMQGATLEEIAANAGVTIKEFSGVKTSSSLVPGMGLEPRVIGVLETVTADGAGKVLPLIEGKNGVYAVVVDEVAVEATQTAEAERVKAQAQIEAMAGGRAMWAVKDAAKIEDNTVKFF